MSLPSLPSHPAGVRYALTVPQSVLFADISLRGTRRDAFTDVFGKEFELDFVVIDDGAMSWDFSGDAAFAEAMFDTADPTLCVRRFVSAMGATARAVEKVSWLLSSNVGRRDGSVEDIVTDLRQYWDVYERHMTSLFTFWNVEELLSEALTAMLRETGRSEEVNSGLGRFLVPSEANYFALERRGLERLASRFADPSADKEARQRALAIHAESFGFLLAPFNLGAPPSAASLEDRLQEDAGAVSATPLTDRRPDLLGDVPEPVRELGLLAQELTFWKTERLDVMSLADSRVSDLYRSAALALSISAEQLFAMTREEIDSSLLARSPVVDEDTLESRLSGYCLLLNEGQIGFFQPTRKPADAKAQPAETPEGEIRGTAASSGVVSGPVRRIMDLSEAELLQPGEILVTTMTRPEMGVALDRAAAFVTDEGGRMAHAAIIAREMRKPCVIGTENATQLLQDGMIVTVDGDHGVVTVEDGSGA